jgi:uracil-DNA glycosylase family 4
MSARPDLPSRDRILAEIAHQIEAETGRGTAFWAERGWNDAAGAFLAPQAPPPARGPARPATTPAHPATTPAGSAAAPRRAARPAARSVSATGGAAPKAKLPAFGPPPPAIGRAPDWEAQLDAVRREAKVCVQCPLHETRTHVVFESGSGAVPLVFVGEAPGADEDAQGEAFVGRAGQLLTKIIAAIGLDRGDVYICNVLKCRPPGNRNPLPVEIQTCSPYLERQIDILRPRVICTLGLFASQLLLGTTAPIGQLRGRVFRYRDVPLLPTYHPAALLRNPNLKRTVWEDVQQLRKVLDEGVARPEIEIPGRKEPKPESGRLF